MLTARPATLRDCRIMAPMLREEDKAEVMAAGGVDPLAALVRGLVASTEPVVGVDANDTPVCMGGVVPPSTGVVPGIIWMLATTGIHDHQMSFLRASRRWLDRWHEDFPLMGNCVDERNTVHIRWLRWLGFTFINRHPQYGHEQRPFLEFVRLHHV